jgi:hypothetical protein
MSLITDLTDEQIRTEWRHVATLAEGDDDAADPDDVGDSDDDASDADDDPSDSDDDAGDV